MLQANCKYGGHGHCKYRGIELCCIFLSCLQQFLGIVTVRRVSQGAQQFCYRAYFTTEHNKRVTFSVITGLIVTSLCSASCVMWWGDTSRILLLSAGRAAIDQYLLPAGPSAANAAVVAEWQTDRRTLDTVQTSRFFGLILLHSGLLTSRCLQKLRLQYPKVKILIALELYIPLRCRNEGLKFLVRPVYYFTYVCFFIICVASWRNKS